MYTVKLVSTISALIIDALGCSKSKRYYTRDVIGSGPRWIAGALPSKYTPTIQQAEDFLKAPSFDHDLYMISAMSSDFFLVKKICSILQGRGKIILGGPICSDPHYCLNKLNVDFCVVAEGEVALKTLIESNFDPSGIFNLAYKENDAVLFNGLKRIPKNIYNTLKPSTNTIRGYDNYHFARVFVEVLRGCSNFHRSRVDISSDECTSCNRCRTNTSYDCPLKINPGCGYCSVPSTFGFVKSRSIENICSEMKNLVDLGVQKVVLSAPDFLDYSREELVEGEFLTDPCIPNPNYNRIESLLSLVSEFDIHVTIENVKACLFDEKIAKIISDYVPDSTLHIGCDTADELHSEIIGRPSSPRDVTHALKIAHRYTIKTNVYFIYGLPLQSSATAAKTLHFIKENKGYVDKYTMYRFMPLPMSAFCNKQKGDLNDFDSKKIYDLIKEINTQKKKDMIGAKMEVYVAERHFYNSTDYIGYPTKEGPLVVLRSAKKYFKRRVIVKIIDVISDRLVKGDVIECLN